jgi:hypothetical protein
LEQAGSARHRHRRHNTVEAANGLEDGLPWLTSRSRKRLGSLARRELPV